MRLRAALLVTLVAAGATACGADDGSTARTTPVVATTVATAAPAAVASTMPPTVPAPVERIIPVNGDLAEVVYALGLGDQVVATDISATYPAAAQGTPKIGYQRALVAETILTFEPTVVLADDNTGPPEVLEQVRAAGVRVVDLPHQSTLESVSDKIRAVADALASDTTAATAATTTVAPTTTATTATPSTIPSASGYVPGADPDADAAALAWTTAFDSSLGYDAKAATIADAEARRATIEAYTPAGEVVGGITLEPTDVVITGDTAAIKYMVLFAGTSPYPEQDGTVQRVNGAWVVSSDEFCGFMTMARNPCSR